MSAVEVATRGEPGDERHPVDVWMDEALANLTIEHAWHRAGIEAATYRRRAMDCLRHNQQEAAHEWAVKAAECEKAEDILGMVGKHADEVRKLLQQLEREEALRALRDEQERLEAEARKKKWAKKRAMEKALGKPA